MTNGRDNLATAVTGKPSVYDCSLDELRALVQRHPYYAPAQFLLLQKLKAVNDPDESNQHGKAILYYPDPLLFEHFVATRDTSRVAGPDIVEGSEMEPAIPRTAQDASTLNVSGRSYSETPTDGESPFSEASVLAETINEPELASSIQEAVQTTAFAEVAKPAVQEAELLPLEVESATDGEASNGVRKDEPVQHNEVRPSQRKEQPALIFEPYHTVDYFASQGIKITADAFANNQFDKGLKSFTAWLKTMKRLPVSEVQRATEDGSERLVVAMANDSVTDAAIVTEAMAEVWAKQGATDKAVDIYNKLSLSDPSKSAYFAAKIKNLKSS